LRRREPGDRAEARRTARLACGCAVVTRESVRRLSPGCDNVVLVAVTTDTLTVTIGASTEKRPDNGAADTRVIVIRTSLPHPGETQENRRAVRRPGRMSAGNEFPDTAEP
jgi:hypothetical protein